MEGLTAGGAAQRDREAGVYPVLVGTETGDDAGVILVPPGIPPGLAAAGTGIVQTADFITPPFDDPQAYGEIAAANALSDVYAMGGRPISALNLCVFPAALELAVAREVLHAAQAKLREAGAALLGGHTVRGPELLFGLAVVGVVDPQRIWRNVGGQPGDALLLTKPLGSGLVVSGARKGAVAAADLRQCKLGMAQLNRRAAEILGSYSVHAATDVTGFGLVGHALGMAGTEGTDAVTAAVTIELWADALPVYDGALALAAAGVTCAGAKNNRRAYRERIALPAALPAAYEELLFDPQTAGGLLCALPAAEAPAALAALRAAGVPAAEVGAVRARADHALLIGDRAATSPARSGR
jgi:selenide,water dikinase